MTQIQIDKVVHDAPNNLSEGWCLYFVLMMVGYLHRPIADIDLEQVRQFFFSQIKKELDRKPQTKENR